MADGSEKEIKEMFKNKLVRDRFDKKKGLEQRKEAIARKNAYGKGTKQNNKAMPDL